MRSSTSPLLLLALLLLLLLLLLLMTMMMMVMLLLLSLMLLPLLLNGLSCLVILQLFRLHPPLPLHLLFLLLPAIFSILSSSISPSCWRACPFRSSSMRSLVTRFFCDCCFGNIPEFSIEATSGKEVSLDSSALLSWAGAPLAWTCA